MLGVIKRAMLGNQNKQYWCVGGGGWGGCFRFRGCFFCFVAFGYVVVVVVVVVVVFGGVGSRDLCLSDSPPNLSLTVEHLCPGSDSSSDPAPADTRSPLLKEETNVDATTTTV